MAKRIVVYNTGFSLFQGNRILESGFASRFPGASFLPLLQGMLHENGWDMMTADVFLKERRLGAEAVCLSEAVTPFSRKLIDHGVVPKVVFSGESPNVIPWFYRRLESFVRPFRHAYLFRGFRDRVAEGTTFHPFYWPADRDSVEEGASWKERDLLVMIASNKGRHTVYSQRFFRSSALAAVNWLKWQYYEAADPLLRFPDYYEARLEAIKYYCEKPDFRLYGWGWEGNNGLGSGREKRHFHNPPSECADKVATMTRFKFALCFENCAFPGYVTEKIFDCLFAGCVPVYYGAPDITEFCPRECFVDFRDFRNYEELEAALRDFPESDWQAKRNVAREYLNSGLFLRHRQMNVASNIMRCLLD